jgi:hypothetical protein
MPGSYQVGDAPQTPQQKAKDYQTTLRAKAAAASKQKVQSMAPGSDPETRAKIAATPADKPVSFSDQD